MVKHPRQNSFCLVGNAKAQRVKYFHLSYGNILVCISKVMIKHIGENFFVWREKYVYQFCDVETPWTKPISDRNI